MLQGSIVALVTPFKQGEVDEDALGQLIEWQLAQGTEAIAPCGCTGEAATLTHEEHCRVVEFTVKTVAGRCPVIAGAGSNNTREAILLTRHARESGADAALVITPYYNKPTPAGLYEHYLAIAREVDLPIMLYNVPSRTGVSLLPETVARLAEHPGIRYIKEASGSLDQVSSILHGSNITVLSGDDSLTLPMLAIGAKGVVSVAANIIPGAIRDLVRAWREGEPEKAREIHFRFYELIRALFYETNPIPVKTVLAWLGKIRPEWRAPLGPMAPENEKKLRAAVERAGLL